MIKTVQIKIVLIIAIASLVTGLVAGGALAWSYCKSSSYRGVIKQQKSDAKESMKHEQEQVIVTKYVDRIKQVLVNVPDPTGCLDTDSPPDYLDSMLDADRKTRP